MKAIYNQDLAAERVGVIYARYSSDKQSEQSIEGQVRVCQEYAAREKINIVKVYADRATTGKNDNRKGFQRMLLESARKKFGFVIVYKLDRFARNRYDSAINKAKLKANNVRVMSAMEPITDSPEGILLESVLEGYNEYFSAELSQKTKRGRRETMLKGEFCGGQVPFGFRIVNKKWTVHPFESAFVKDMYDMLVKDNKTLKQICDYLNANGARRKSGKPFTVNAVSQIIRRQRNMGEKHEGTDYIPAVVDEAVFKRANAILDAHKLRPTFFKSDTPFLLSGKTFCGYCRSTIAADRGTGRSGATYTYYACHQHKKYRKPCEKVNIRKDFLEEKIVGVIQEHILTDELIAEIADRVSSKFNEFVTQNELLDKFRKKNAENERAIDNILAAMEQGVVTASTKDRLLKLEKRKEELEHNIAVQSSIQREPLTIEEITDYLYSFKGLDCSLESNKKRLIHLFIRKVILYNDKCEVYFNFTDRAEALLSLDESLETARTAPTSVGDGSQPLVAAHKINKPEHNYNVFEFVNFGCGGRTRTSSLRVMSPTSYRCSTPR
ncbi:recombinase RecD [Clostridia bacterium]|nr:recombinase RecD [Clostridia bacterium]